jgi:hypothetical protein
MPRDHPDSTPVLGEIPQGGKTCIRHLDSQEVVLTFRTFGREYESEYFIAPASSVRAEAPNNLV